MTTRILFTIIILTLTYFNTFSQTKEDKFDRVTISYTGDSLLTQKYELIIKSKKVYFITPVISYLHVKGEKYKRRVKFSKDTREEIFDLVDQLTWADLGQIKAPINQDPFYVIETFNTDKLISFYKISEVSLPSDFRTLYENIREGK